MNTDARRALAITCVLRSGGDYDASYVRALRNGVRRYLLIPHRFVCLSDVEFEIEGVDRIPLVHDWPGWWSKMEVFRPDAIQGPVLYMDLDTLPVGNLDEIAGYKGDLAMIWNLNGKRRDKQSAVMAFEAGPGTYAASLFDAFQASADRDMREHRGDGEWLNVYADQPDALQDLYPGAIVSYKWQARYGSPPDARLVSGHGQPRFHDPAAGWVHELWRERAFPPVEARA